ncbi:MAG: helix-turn-helix domain-containing protein [Nitrososphaerota archaeon]|nr:helix-turn-helix domain-containing protein [Nitrososphaerota archaeon]
MKELTIEIGKEYASSLPCNPGSIVKVVSCRPHEHGGMIEYVEIISKSPIGETLDKLVNDPNINHTSFHIFDEFRASGIITTRKAPICRLISSSGGFCRTCQQEYGLCESKVKWRIVLPDGASLNTFLQDLKRNGVDVQTVDVGDLRENGLLTSREEEAVRLAEEMGYFRFPRKTSLRELSKNLSISVSTLDEILRRAEGKIVKSHIKKPNSNSGKKNQVSNSWISR